MAIRKGEGAYRGTHWTQKPENREKLMAMVRASKKRSRKPRAERIIAAAIKRGRPPKKASIPEDTSILLNGWRITLGHKSIKIEQS